MRRPGPQIFEGLRRAGAVRLPKRRGLGRGIFLHERVVVRGQRPVIEGGGALKPGKRRLARGPAPEEQRHKRCHERCHEHAQDAEMHARRQELPQLEDRHQRKHTGYP